MSFPYKKVLLIGATSGIGYAMANRLVSEGVKIVAVGRRQERLDKLVSQHGKDKVIDIRFDISKLDEIPRFVEGTLKEHPDIDCFFLNAGVQGIYNLTSPDQPFDLAAFQNEVTVNFSAHVALVHALLPHMLKRKEKTGLIFTGTKVNVVPVYVMPAYSASKAALDAFIMCLREQVKDTNIKVVNIIAGPVQTELHDAGMGERGSSFGMPLKDFIAETYEGLVSGSDDIYPSDVGGSTKEQFSELVKKRDEAFVRMSDIIRYVAQNS